MHIFPGSGVDKLDYGILFPQTIGMFSAALFDYLVFGYRNKEKNNFFKDKTFYKHMCTGVFQFTGALTFIISIILNGNVIAQPLGGLSVVVGTLLSIFFLKEKKEHPYSKTTYIGLSLLVIGSVMCGLIDTVLQINI
jgi:glucose uptake protein GlcU